ncbi:MAG: hypothetical protein E7634_06905 [Ruminococcaceae bacterium]|nr:hypothetical protein [Oscillospiraceae bacterium]
MSTYYIDQINGNDENDGLSPEKAKKNHASVDAKAGDKLLFKRGSFIRGTLKITEGEDGYPITYGAYGEGEKPTFCASTDVSDAGDWEETDKNNVWRCVKPIPGDVGNFVFGEGDCSAAFRWNKEELSAQGDFNDSRFAQGEQYRRNYTEQEVLMYSEKNPAQYYGHIEAVSYAGRSIGTLKSNVIIEDLRVMNSGVHGFAGAGRNVTVRRCDFENIGGCGWNRDLKIRFGNAVEFWIHAENVLVEDCSFKNVYDSCITHQGPGDKTVPARRFDCRGNIFDTYGMAAFEYRDKLPIDSHFTDNICKNAGCGFAMLGEELPRKSEIWPQPMGHHIFLWRIPKATEGGSLVISGNTFGPAPVGAAIYSIISAEAEAQMTLDNNKYTKNDILLNRFGGENFSDLADYVQKTGKDKNSSYIE